MAYRVTETGHISPRDVVVDLEGGGTEKVTVPPRGRPRLCQAAAAVCLAGQSFGFTKADVVNLHEAASMLRSKGLMDYTDRLESLAERIAALAAEV